MRKMWGERWKGQDSVLNDESDQEDSVEYNEWLQFVTRKFEASIDDLGVQAKWEELVVQRKFGWAGHMARRGDDRRTSRFARAQEKRRKRARCGRPVIRWHDTFVSFVGDDWTVVAQNREDWRPFLGEVAEFTRMRFERHPYGA